MFFLLAALSFTFALIHSAASPLSSFRMLVAAYLVIPTAIGFRAPGGFPLPIVSITRTYFLGFLLGFAVNRMFAAVSRRPMPWIAINFAIYVAYIIATSFFSLSRQWDVKDLLSEKVIGAMVIFFIAYWVIRRDEDFLYLLRGLYVGVVVLALVALGEAATGARFNSLSLVRSLSELDPETFALTAGGTVFAERGGFTRVESTFEHSIYLGLALTMVLPFLLTLRRRVPSVLAAVTVPSSVLASIFTFSRTAWLSVVGAAFFARRSNRTLFVLTLLALLFIGVPFLTRSFQTSSYIDTSAFAARSRVSLLVNTVQNVSLRTGLFGIGLGGIDYLLSDFETRRLFQLGTQSLERIPADNSLAASFLTTGLIGTGLFLLIFYRLARFFHEAARGSSGLRRLLLRATLYCLVVQVAIFCISNSVFENPRLTVVLFALLGSAVGIAQPVAASAPEATTVP